MTSRVFETESVDLALFLTTAGYEPTIYPNPTGKRAVFEFPESENLHEAIINYERGADLSAKKLLNVRSWLFREAGRICREARG
jgi:hypothetical protein